MQKLPVVCFSRFFHMTLCIRSKHYSLNVGISVQSIFLTMIIKFNFIVDFCLYACWCSKRAVFSDIYSQMMSLIIILYVHWFVLSLLLIFFLSNMQFTTNSCCIYLTCIHCTSILDEIKGSTTLYFKYLLGLFVD